MKFKGQMWQYFKKGLLLLLKSLFTDRENIIVAVVLLKDKFICFIIV